MKVILGLAIILGCLYAAIEHLHQTAASYYDFVGFAMVLGGTIAISVMTIPVSWTQLFQFFKFLFASPSWQRKRILKVGLELLRARESQQNLQVPKMASSLAKQTYLDGTELIGLGFSTDKIEAILSERIERYRQVGLELSGSFRSLAKYPPAFGLAGTVLGLVHLMRGISEGMDSAETGIRMAIALVATFYGLLVSNALINPIGEVIEKGIQDEIDNAELALQAVVLVSENESYLESQELLNSYVNPYQREKFHLAEAA